MAGQVNRRQALSLIGGLVGYAILPGCQSTGPGRAPEIVYNPSDFVTKHASPGNEGVVVGVPYAHQSRDPLSQVVANRIAEQTGFGMVSSYVQRPFRVYYPAEGLSGSIRKNDFTPEARAVYNAFLDRLKEASVSGSLDHAFIVLNAKGRTNYPYVDALTMGYSNEERKQMKSMYSSLLDKLPRSIRKRELIFLREDRVKYLYPDLLNEGALLHPNRGIGIVTSRMDEETAAAYGDLLAEWTGQVVRTFKRNPNVETHSLDDGIFGRFTKFPGKNLDAIITAPHGGDTFSDAIAEGIASSLDLDALVVNGFNASRWEEWQRINISRPTERMARYENESHTNRARKVFELYRDQVAGLIDPGTVPILVEIHTTFHRGSRNSIQIASQGLGFDEAKALAEVYMSARHGEPLSLTDRLTLEIEPLHDIYMNAKGTKEAGIFNPSVAGIEFPIAFQIELPMRVFYSRNDNGPGNQNLRSYMRIMTEVVRAAASLRKS